MSAPGPNEDSVSERKNEELCQPECKVARSFLELFKLLEEYAPVWYTFETHNRAATAKLLLDASVLRSTASDSAGEQEGPDHLELHYACKILYLAVRSAIGSERPLAERLLKCYLDLPSLDIRRRLPADLRQRLDTITNALSRAEGPSGRKRTVTATIGKMGEQEVLSWLDEILNLLVDANRRHARAERP
jgi:hypothetical protein